MPRHATYPAYLGVAPGRSVARASEFTPSAKTTTSDVSVFPLENVTVTSVASTSLHPVIP